MPRINVSILLVVITGVICVTLAQNSPHRVSGYTPQRVYDSRDKRFSDFESMLAGVSRADIVLVGEQHDDPNTHRIERSILEGLARRRSSIVLALEMFERDVQGALNEYLAGRTTEDAFLTSARPWPRYATDYRPLVEFARAHAWPVIAGNVPRRYASQVARTGLSAIDLLPPEERTLIASRIQCPMDEYFERFSETMSRHPGSDAREGTAKENKNTDGAAKSQQRATIERFYFAQCVKDETMAESIARQYQDGSSASPLTVHFNGAFHSDFGLGTAARVKSRLPKSTIKVISIIPVSDLDVLNPDEYRKRGDYVVFTLKPIAPVINTAGKEL
ncbi:MAG: ChaN family lipoprotein [Acidobacteriota bacterium]